MKKVIIKIMLSISILTYGVKADSQNSWTQKASLTAFGGRFDATGFSIGNNGYVGGGWTSSGFVNDFWKWNRVSNTWTPIASYPGAGRYGMTSFTINGKGYTCLGWTGSFNAQDLWQYDSATDTWTQKASFPGNGRYGSFVFVIGTKAYIGCGEPNGQPYYSDMWEYDAIANSWTQKASFPGGNRSGTTGFALGNFGYAGCGGNGIAFNDMWKYDPIGNSWTSIASIPMAGSQMDQPVNFVINGTAYVGTSYDIGGGKYERDFFKYDAVGNTWSPIATLPGVGRWCGVGLSMGNYGYCGFGWDSASNFLPDYWEYGPAADTNHEQPCNFWEQKSSLTAFGGRFDATGFSIGNNGYVGGGQTSSGFVNDFWKWNRASNTWTPITSYPGNGRYGMTSFTINGKGYTCLGWSGSFNAQDLWEYDSATNAWTQKASFPGNGRYGSFVFVIGTKAYIGCGEPNGQPYYSDMWEYDAIANSWTQKASFPGGNRSGTTGFALGNYGYAGCGGNGLAFNDMWKYDPIGNSWSAIASIPMLGSDMDQPVNFVINGTAYVGTSYDIGGGKYERDFFKYDAGGNSWSPIETLPGVGRWCGVGLSMGNYGYCGFGWDSNSHYLTDFWQYTPCGSDTLLSVNQVVNEAAKVNLYPNPSKGKFTVELSSAEEKAKLEVYNTMGEMVYFTKLSSDQAWSVDMSNQPAGIYLYRIISDKEIPIYTGKLIIQ